MSIQNAYDSWCKKAVEDKDLIAELDSIKDNEEEKYERFYTSL